MILTIVNHFQDLHNILQPAFAGVAVTFVVAAVALSLSERTVTFFGVAPVAAFRAVAEACSFFAVWHSQD